MNVLNTTEVFFEVHNLLVYCKIYFIFLYFKYIISIISTLYVL